MSELEDEWEARLAEADRRARGAGRGDVVDYLNLRAANDAARALGVEWLLASFTNTAGEANRRSAAGLSVARQDNHRFQSGNSTMVGTLLMLRAACARYQLGPGGRGRRKTALCAVEVWPKLTSFTSATTKLTKS
ncbi:MAG: hypothetical protein WKF30_13020 [Pyrinomonadaceae bacterium]